MYMCIYVCVYVYYKFKLSVLSKRELSSLPETQE